MCLSYLALMLRFAYGVRMDGKNKRHDTFNSHQGEHRHHNPTPVCSFIMIRPIFFLFTRLISPSMNRQN
ncbi:hypothetical protein HanRHA438_Chr09g0393691 [Helianthus annuus]|uniref:Uncharacterized protein n=1 Tax=Helianthus annuus TaxID=4232 RepID=A0A9K3N7N1_HELAN|nr:hypothetical protein HanXRQr2_Chr09g0382201 [Helianthus annuus]KAJ0525577.1 hypothetical protein HanHA300_Chr09g0313631 [Helianthus annuus]KAJ0541962.1 hypothetical protein HanHA89_Chr09g0334521 [Helianthus annuus]KAJ0707030.1 hypothetical protein HanLR1_Chr09g0313891 [Helianthus annuus]KAJ0711051.1 hypothetical protein HanOQP8_Chr09g0319481 [Helianthus annuus]